MIIDPIEFVKYDKISDDVYAIGSNVVLKFNVSLSKISTDGKRYHYYKEFEYPSRNKDILITIKRSFDYYLSIENIQKNKTLDDKAFIRIGPPEFHKFKSQIDEAVSWFTNKKYKSLYVKNKGQLVLTSPVPESSLGGYPPQNKFIRIIPIVIDRNEGKDRAEPGVEIDLSNYDNYAIMNIDKLMGLYYLLNNFNMYMAAQTMINYFEAPQGLNRISMNNSYNSKTEIVEDKESVEKSVNGRVIGKFKNITTLE